MLFLIQELSWVSLRSHHGSYINWAMSAVQIITFPSVHYVAILRLLIIDDPTYAPDSVSGTDHIHLSMGLLKSIVLENASLCSVPTYEGRLSSASRCGQRFIIRASGALVRYPSLIFRDYSGIYLEISVLIFVTL